MADYWEAYIDLRKSDVESRERLRQAIQSDWGLPDADLHTIMHENQSSVDGIVRIFDDSAREGCFGFIEDYCEANKIPYDRWTGVSSYEDSPAYKLYYRPGSKDEFLKVFTDEGRVYLPMDEVQTCLKSQNPVESMKKLIRHYTPVPLKKL